MRSEGWGGQRGRVVTGEDESTLLGEDIAVVLPFRSVAVDGPAFAEFGDAEAVEDLVAGAVDVDVGVWLGFFFGDVVAHLDCYVDSTMMLVQETSKTGCSLKKTLRDSAEFMAEGESLYGHRNFL